MYENFHICMGGHYWKSNGPKITVYPTYNWLSLAVLHIAHCNLKITDTFIKLTAEIVTSTYEWNNLEWEKVQYSEVCL